MPSSPRAVLLYMTFPSAAQAEQLVRQLLEERLIACANVLPSGMSFYRWEGKVEASYEPIVFAKTLASLAPQVQKRFQELHPYECPVILTLPLEEAPPAVLSWLIEAVS